MKLVDKIIFAIVALLLAVAAWKIGNWIWDYGHASGVKAGRVQMQQELEEKGKMRADMNSANNDAVVSEHKERIVYRDRYITKVEEKIKYVAAPLNNCIVPVDAVKLWNNQPDCLLDAKAAGCQAN